MSIRSLRTISRRSPGIAALLCLAVQGAGIRARPVSEVGTVFKWRGPDDKVVVEAYDDPVVAGVTCDVSRARTGDVTGALGLAEDKVEASIACRQVGVISVARPIRQQDEMFNERLSLLFKKLRVARMADVKRNALVYLSYSDRLINGSPQNSVSVVHVDRSMPIPQR